MFKGRLVVATILALVSLSAPAAGGDRIPGDPVWVAKYENPEEGRSNYLVGVDVSPTRDRVFVTGWNYHEDETTDFATVAYDGASGQELWTRTFGPTNSDQAYALAAAPIGGRVYVVGSSDSGHQSDFVTVAYTGQGRRAWVRWFRAEPESGEYAYAVAVSPDATRVFVTGEVGLTNGDTNLGTVAYDAASGALLWKRQYNGAIDASDLATAIAVSPDGNRVYVSGYNFGGLGQAYDYMTVAYDAATGSLVGAAGYNGPGNDWDIAQSVAVSPDSTQVYVTGGSPDVTGRDDFATIAYTADLATELWVQRYDAGGSESGADLVVSPDGSAVHVVGHATAGATAISYASQDGQQLWVDSFGSGSASLATLDSAGETLFVGGYVDSEQELPDFLVLAYDTVSGARLWHTTYDSGSSDYVNGLAVAPDGSRVYAGGLGGADYLTVAFSTS